MPNVIFKVGTLAQYQAILTKDSNTLYWLEDVQQLWKGDKLFGTGAVATATVDGLMSAVDKERLDTIWAGGVTFEVPEYAIEKQDVAEDGYAASYKLKRTMGDASTYVGDTINIPKDLVVSGGSLQVVTVVDEPYAGARVGDPYIDIVLSDAEGSHIYIPVKGLVDVYLPGDGITIVDGKIGVQIDTENANGLTVGANGIGIGLATPETAGAMSAVDKVALDKVVGEYTTQAVTEDIAEMVEYEITNYPVGTLVDYREKEIRVMIPSDTKFERQQSGTNADANAFYIGFRAYAPNGDVVSFKEDLAETIGDSTMYYFEGNDFAGVDKHGRKYSVVWLPVARFDDATGTWTHYGANSTTDKYIGWHYSVEWYNADGVVVGSDTIRIDLSNENCHAGILPYYMSGYATTSQVEELSKTFTWETM